MTKLTLSLPIQQNWSCHNCGGCCRQHLVEITAEERQRILDQNWTAADGIPATVSPVVTMGGLFRKKSYRLAHQPDGACIFLNEQGLCKIHAKFGEPAKPIACRVYPYAFHPYGNGLTVSMRFSCPSVVANKGKPVPLQRADIQQLALEAVPTAANQLPPPRLSSAVQLDWPDTKIVLQTLDRELQRKEIPFMLRLLRINTWMELLGQSSLKQIHGPQLQQMLDLIVQAAEIDQPILATETERPSRAAFLIFRLICSIYCRKESVADLSAGLSARWRLLRSMIGFVRGQGKIPVLHDAFLPVEFRQLEEPFAMWPEGADDLFTHYFRVKVQGVHFCGLGYYRVPIVEGWRHLFLFFPVTLWMARWLAAGRGRRIVELADLSKAITIADHHHGFHPVLGAWNSRQRVRMLAQMGELTRLTRWYASSTLTGGSPP